MNKMLMDKIQIMNLKNNILNNITIKLKRKKSKNHLITIPIKPMKINKMNLYQKKIQKIKEKHMDLYLIQQS